MAKGAPSKSVESALEPSADARAVGARLRNLRRRDGATLDQLAKSAGVHKAYLSRLEGGTRSASIATLTRLAKVLKVSLASLFGEQTNIAEIHVTRNSLRQPSNKSVPERIQSLVAAGGDEALSAFMIFPTAAFSWDGPATHPGHEFIYVVKGKIEIRFADRLLELARGDALLFPGHLPHLVRRRSVSAVVLVVINNE